MWYQYIEDNGGGLYLFVFAGEEVLAGIENLEYAQAGEWNDVKDGLAADPLVEVGGWDGHLDNPQEAYNSLVREQLGYEIVCQSGKLYPDSMGRAAQRYFGEAAAIGRPPLYGESMTQTAVHLTEPMREWLKSQGNASEVIRGLIIQAMNSFAPGVVLIKGPFESPESANEWRFQEENYQPGYRTVQDSGKSAWFVVSGVDASGDHLGDGWPADS